MATVLWDTQIFSPQNRRCPGLELGIQISPQFLGCRTSSAQSRARVLARRGLATLVSSLADWGRPPANGEPGWGGVGVAEHLSLVSSGPQSPHSRILTPARKGWRTRSGWVRSLKTMSSAGTRTVRAARETRKPTTTLSWGEMNNEW